MRTDKATDVDMAWRLKRIQGRVQPAPFKGLTVEKKEMDVDRKECDGLRTSSVTINAGRV